jgi:hypothetical protein
MSIMGTPIWSSFLDAATREQALAIARRIADDLRDPARLAGIIELASTQSPIPEAGAWGAASLAGDMGLALAFGHLAACFPGEGWERDAHRHLEIAARRFERLATPEHGMFGGLSGLGLAASCLARGGPRYGRLLERVDESVAQAACALAGRIVSERPGLHIAVFDAVSGIAGTVAYLLQRRGRSRVDEALRTAAAALVVLSEDTGGLPIWHTPARLVASQPHGLKAEHAEGYLDCGLAHGVPGPLAVLSLAVSAGVDVPGGRDAVLRLADWLLDHRRDDAWGMNWPAAIPLTIDAAGEARPVPPGTALGKNVARSGWCYGGPGIARALWYAGAATGEARLKDAAIDVMRATLRRTDEERRLPSATFCHGVAGYLQCLLRFANETQLPELVDAARVFTRHLVDMRDEGAALGYPAVEMFDTRVDQPGLVDGAAGVMGVLLSASVEVEPAWDRAFLLS